MWAGYAGTYFWVDPKEEIVGVYMTQAPSPIRAYYRRMFKTRVYQCSWMLVAARAARAGRASPRGGQVSVGMITEKAIGRASS